MVVLNLSHNNYKTLLLDLATQLKVKPENNSIIIPIEIGEGIIKVIELPNGLQTLMLKIIFYKDGLIKNAGINPGDYILNFDELEIHGKEKTDEENTLNSFVRLTGATFKHWEKVKKNSVVQYVKILFKQDWLSKYIGLSEKMSMFEKYIPIKSDAAEKQKLSDDYRKIIKELWLVNANDPLQNIYNNNRILLLVEHFFTAMHDEMLNPKGKFKITGDDIIQLKKVESILNSPGKSPPDIALLAKKAFMTKVKLANAFKQVYGNSIYNYYQNQRLQKAYELLSSKNLSVKQVSEKVGYTNLSNFVLAFTKQFNTSPKNLLEEVENR